jgi:peptide subunit release factor 1 (eRF1)
MLSENDLRELLDFHTDEPVLSIYLSTDPSEGNADTHIRRLRSMLKEINLTEEIQAIERFFTTKYNWSGRGVAVFSCNPKGFFRAYPLAVPVRNLIHISDRPSVKPLAALLDNYGGYGVVLVDKQGARLFFFHMGELREQEGVLGEAVRRAKHGVGGSTVPGRRGATIATRGMDEVIDRNMKDSAAFAMHFFEENHVRRILVGGTEENTKLFCSLLPKAWQSLVMGTFPMSMTASQNDVRSRALELGIQAETEREKRLVERLITQAAKGEGAVTGLEETLNALNHGRIQALVIGEGFRKNAYRCKSTGWLTTKPEEACAGADDIEKVYDVVDVIVNQVMRNGGEVDVVMSSAELEKKGSIGAILRY